MYRIHLQKGKNKYEFEELVKVFLKTDEYQFDESAEHDEKGTDCVEQLKCMGPDSPNEKEIIDIYVPDFPEYPDRSKKEKENKNQIKRYLFHELQHHTGETPDWGILTGVRPVKLAGELLQRESSAGEPGRNTESAVREILIQDYFLKPEKADLLLSIAAYQNKILKPSPQEAVGLYIGIPFCPTRCVYCSFPSNQAKTAEIEKYLDALHREIAFVSEQMTQIGWYPESVYIGGGTPTSLTAEQLDELLHHVTKAFDFRQIREFTVEAGRPDTITAEKLAVIRKSGAQRISINPQSMNLLTLERIGRAHRPGDIVEAFRLAREAGIPMINTDVIAGLPEEEEEDFARTLEQILALAPENITVHTLALKRASRLKEIDSEYNYKQGKRVRRMLDCARKMLDEAGYKPYYLYRQKQMTGNFENVGYAKGDTAGIYNIRIMEEAQTIVALGAGGISKAYYPDENRLERIPNVTNYEIYVDRLDEMLRRKREGLFNSDKETDLISVTEQEAPHVD